MTPPKLSSLGNRILTDVPKAPLHLVDDFADRPTTDIADAVTRLYTMTPGIHPLYTPMRRIAGSAVTVKVPPGDNLMVHAALSFAGEGDVIVVDAGGNVDYCLGGALMCGIAQHNGVRGFVLDGAYRDAAELQKLDFPIFGRALNPRPPKKTGPGEINVPIQCGGVTIRPGDIVVADEEGIAVVPLEFAEVVLEKVKERGRTDSNRWSDLARFEKQHRDMYDKILADSNVDIRSVAGHTS